MTPGTVCLVLEPSYPSHSWYCGILGRYTGELRMVRDEESLYEVLPLLNLRLGELIRNSEDKANDFWKIIPESRLVPVYTPKDLEIFQKSELKDAVALIDVFNKESKLSRLAVLERSAGSEWMIGVCDVTPRDAAISLNYGTLSDRFLIFPHHLPGKNVKILEFDSENLHRGDIVFDFDENFDLRFGTAFDAVTAEIPYCSRSLYLNLIENGMIGEKDPERLARVVLSRIDPSKIGNIPKVRARKANPSYGTW
jgi:hypothetical protein